MKSQTTVSSVGVDGDVMMLFLRTNCAIVVYHFAFRMIPADRYRLLAIESSHGMND